MNILQSLGTIKQKLTCHIQYVSFPIALESIVSGNWFHKHFHTRSDT